ncbi:hypothetical protein P4305_18615 [Bacillus thuringiensis]|nr:hypothetical protein [Bacillus thuringiensis]
MKDITPRYIIAIYDTVEDRDTANKVYKDFYKGTFMEDKLKIEAVCVGEQIRGRRWQGQRIGKVIDCTTKRPINTHWWYNIVKPSLAPDCKFDNGEVFLYES